MVRIAFAVLPAILAVLLAVSPVGAASAGGARCHCPCSAVCGGGISCDCTGHSESCKKCSCGHTEIQIKDVLAGTESSARPTLRASYAPWFAFEPEREIQAAIEGTIAGSGDTKSYRMHLVLESAQSMTYVPDSSFDAKEFREWIASLDRERPLHLYSATVNDPATYRILDGNPGHLNDSMLKVFEISLGNDRWAPVFKSDSTLGWEMLTYLRSAVGQLDDGAFAADPAESKGRMYDLLQTADVLIKASNFAGAAKAVDDLLARGESTWLARQDESAASTLCAFRKLRKLLDPETASASRPSLAKSSAR